MLESYLIFRTREILNNNLLSVARCIVFISFHGFRSTGANIADTKIPADREEKVNFKTKHQVYIVCPSCPLCALSNSKKTQRKTSGMIAT